MEQPIFKLGLGLNRLGLAEARLGFGEPACVMQGVGKGRSINAPLARVGAPVSMRDGALAVANRFAYFTKSYLQLAEIVGGDRGV